MHVSFRLGIAGHWCEMGLYPLSWMIFAQVDDLFSNYAFGPLRLVLNKVPR
jgi:hypothetical protein